MENTACLKKIPLSSDIITALRPSKKFLFLLFQDPKLRPPVLDEMMDDLQRIITMIAQRYCDNTAPCLRFEDLRSEGNMKLAELISKGYIDNADKCPSREHFFKFFKAVINNHTRSLVQKYRFTEKRTGVKPPPKYLRNNSHLADENYHKNVELSLNDKDLGIQLEDRTDSYEEDIHDINWGWNSILEDYAFGLSPFEKLVLHELVRPGPHARCYAEEESWRGHKRNSVKITYACMAKSLGIPLDLFKQTVQSLQNKIRLARMSTSQDIQNKARRNAILAQLKQVFGLQIPNDIEEVVVRRMLTFAARDQYEKLENNPQLCELLTEVGAKVPRPVADNKLSCYGILYQRTARQCNMCDLRQSCATECANLGLTNMVISPKLLGSRQVRIPAFMPADQSSPKLTLADETEILAHLDETFEKSERSGIIFYSHKIGSKSKRKFIFCVKSMNPLKLKFCDPSPSLKQRLVIKQKNWFPPDDATLAEFMDMIDQHAKETFR